MDDAVTLDPWSGLNHKAGMKPDDNGGPNAVTLPSWLGTRTETVRRLNAYVRLSAYLTNQAREFLRTADEQKRLSHREYGEPAVFVERIAAGVLGEEPRFVITGSDAPLSPAPDIPRPPSELPETGDPEIDRLVAGSVEEAWREDAKAAIDAWIAARSSRAGLVARQEWLDAWAESDQAIAKIRQTEGDAVGLGDGVLEIGWSPTKRDPITGESGAPTLTVYDPDAYHPVLSDAPGDGYPTTVHLAWGFEDNDGNEFVRRITYRLAPNEAPADELTEETKAAAPARRYPYAPDVESRVACYYSDITWPIDSVGDRTVWTLTRSGGRPEQVVDTDGELVDAVDVFTGLDYIPLVHLPNTLTSGHFGTSSIARVLQILDDIAKTDSDVQSAGELAGFPPVGVPGQAEEGFTLEPGAVYGLTDGGQMSTLDTASSVTVLSDLAEDLRSTLAVNLQVPKGLIGKVEASEVPSGLALALTFTSFVQLIQHLRLIRQHKYALVVKMVQRSAIAAGRFDDDPTAYPGGLAFGSFMPNDAPAIVDAVAKLFAANVIGRELALRLLKGVGYDIDDIPAEILAAQAADTEGAVNVVNSTDSPELAAQYLGLEIPTPDEENEPFGTVGAEPAAPQLSFGQ